MHSFAFDLVSSFGIPEYLLQSPVSTDYVAYNSLPWLKGTQAKLWTYH